MADQRSSNRLSHIMSSLAVGTEAKAIPAGVSGTGSPFDHVPRAPLDPILGTKILYQQDTDPRKMNLGIGAYRTNEGKPYVLQCVRQVSVGRVFRHNTNVRRLNTSSRTTRNSITSTCRSKVMRVFELVLANCCLEAIAKRFATRGCENTCVPVLH